MNPAIVEKFVGQVVTDMAASVSAVMTVLGKKLGLYKTMSGAGPLTAAELAKRTATHERYVREWLNNQAAGGYVLYRPTDDTYELPVEHALVLADEDSPVYMAGGMLGIGAMWFGEEKISNAFRTGSGIGWHEQHPCLHLGTEYMFRTGYRAHLVSEWLPKLDGVVDKLRNGAKVADVGCGHGSSTVILAQAFPQSTFWGFDYHPASIETSTARAQEAGVQHRTRFEVASAKTYPGTGYDLICFMDCLHDLGDPLGAAKHALQALSPGGTVMLVEPFAGDSVEANLNPVGRLFYAASTAFCTPNSISQEGATVLGAQAGEARLREIFLQAGFTRFRRATETPFNIILEARP
jgi:2-polyprenyl-3-methyl-5-hydroxy-6-metoxy-1,4-benzoquinol methylase